MFLLKTHCNLTRVKELIAGVKQSNCQISGDPKNLELNLRDLHPASWFVLCSNSIWLIIVCRVLVYRYVKLCGDELVFRTTFS